MVDTPKIVAAHDQAATHSYTMHYPPHPARTDDPHYVDFNHYHRTHGPTARCVFALRYEPDGAAAPVLGGHGGYAKRLIGEGEIVAGCDITHPMELHHAHVEFSLQQGVDLAVLERDYPGISDPNQVGAWVESEANFEWLCAFHHRGHGGVHVAAASDFEAERYVRGLIT
jgi:hypothetical protein